jgi:thymidylate kinase
MENNNSLIVLIDGPRGSGKSTIAQGVVERLTTDGIKALYFKKGVRSADNEERNMIDHLNRFSLPQWNVVVIDRFLLTEWVMSTWHSRLSSRELFEGCHRVNEQIKKINALHYCILAPSGVLDERIKKRGTRGWDMDKDAAVPLWIDACRNFNSSVVIKSNVEHNRHLVIINEIYIDVKIRLGETTNE